MAVKGFTFTKKWWKSLSPAEREEYLAIRREARKKGRRSPRLKSVRGKEEQSKLYGLLSKAEKLGAEFELMTPFDAANVGQSYYLDWIKSTSLGVGAMLLKELCVIADEYGREVILVASHGDPKLIKLYKKFDFEVKDKPRGKAASELGIIMARDPKPVPSENSIRRFTP